MSSPKFRMLCIASLWQRVLASYVRPLVTSWGCSAGLCACHVRVRFAHLPLETHPEHCHPNAVILLFLLSPPLPHLGLWAMGCFPPLGPCRLSSSALLLASLAVAPSFPIVSRTRLLRRALPRSMAGGRSSPTTVKDTSHMELVSMTARCAKPNFLAL